MRPDVLHPSILRELVEVLTELLSMILQSWQTGKVPVVSKCGTHLQEWPEGGFRGQQVSQTFLFTAHST